MDDIYEFENSEYRLAAMQVKATAYDIVTGISKKKNKIEKNDKNQTELSQSLTEISNKVIELTDSLEEQLEKLDRLIESKNERVEQKIESEPMIKEAKINQIAISEPSLKVEEQKEEESRLENEINNTSQEEALPPKKFQKMTKSMSKAIMVRPNQLTNLRKSRKYQEQVLADNGIFKKSFNKVEKPNLKSMGPKQLPDDIERQIEDLTVKANIYYNEGEIEQAQQLYDKIKELNQQYQ